MTEPNQRRDGRADGADAERRPTWGERRRAKIAAEIARNRRGEYAVPTWVLALTLVLFVAGWLALVIAA